MADAYKTSQFCQYPPDAEVVYSYFESRQVETPITFFGLQPIIREYLTTPITRDDVDAAEELILSCNVPFNRKGWDHVLNRYGGYMPVTIRAVPEGTVVDGRNALFTIHNDEEDSRTAWCTSYLETMLVRVWYPCTVATISRLAMETIASHWRRTTNYPEYELAVATRYSLVDFGARGTSSHGSAGIGGAAHLVNFRSTDTLEGVYFAKTHYGSRGVIGGSIPAMEHSTVTSWGRDGELDAYDNMMERYAANGLFAVVVDSYDWRNAVDQIWGVVLQAKLRGTGATVVIRPDSGDPTRVPIEVVEMLGERFGYTINSRGYRVLDPCVSVIQGDGINLTSIDAILGNLSAAGFSAENLSFGMGSGLLQDVRRDMFGFAMKCSAVRRSGVWYDVYKEPTDAPEKVSKRGRLALRLVNGRYVTTNRDGAAANDQLVQVYHNGDLQRVYDLDEVRYNTMRYWSQS
jgi:nicotinamide phosphoribosyltransferase